MPPFSSVYRCQIRPHCLRLDWHETARAWSRTLCREGMRIPMSTAMMEITTNSSISVKAFLDIFRPFTQRLRYPSAGEQGGA